MKRGNLLFFKKLAIFLLVILIVDKAAGKILEYFFLKMKAGEPSRISYALNRSNEQLLIFGSSKANHHYVPSVFEDSLHLTAYNAGLDGQRVMYYYGVLKSILSRGAPKMIVLDLHPNEFDNSEIGYNGLSVLLPYYRSHKELQNIIDLRGPYEKYKVFSDLYRYNSLIFTIAVNNVFTKKEKTIKGYYPFYSGWDKPLADESLSPSGDVIDSSKVEFFRQFIDEAGKAGTEVFVFVSPMYKRTRGETKTMKLAKSICGEKNVLYRDYSQFPLFLQHPEYFHDPSHLNNAGAEMYSKMICSDIAGRIK